MKTLALPLFAALILLGWTALAAGAIAALAGEPDFVSQRHQHRAAPPPVAEEPAPLISGTPQCDPATSTDASVPCGA